MEHSISGNTNTNNPIHPFVDWNEKDLEELCLYLEDKHRYSSSGESMAIYRLIDFYREHKYMINKSIRKNIEILSLTERFKIGVKKYQNSNTDFIKDFNELEPGDNVHAFFDKWNIPRTKT